MGVRATCEVADEPGRMSSSSGGGVCWRSPPPPGQNDAAVETSLEVESSAQGMVVGRVDEVGKGSVEGYCGAWCDCWLLLPLLLPACEGQFQFIESSPAV